MPKEKDELILALENKPRERWSVCGWGLGVNYIASHHNGLCVMSKNLAFDSGKKSDRYVAITVSQIKCQQISLLPSF